jgi:hypothetical protein
MKCSNPDCNRGIGLIGYQRGWLSNRRYCSRHCRNAFVADAPKLQPKRDRPLESDFDQKERGIFNPQYMQALFERGVARGLHADFQQ